MGQERVKFGSKIGAILAAAGSAVGLGNIWRFPSQAGDNGGAAFILVYILSILLLGLPIMIAEFVIGRHTRANTAKAYQILAPGTRWKALGLLGVLAGFLILSFYSVVAGWTLEYFFQAATGGFANQTAEGFIQDFAGFSANPWRPLVWLAVFMFSTHHIITRGVQSGIERYSKILMPGLFILLIILAACSMSLPNAQKGLAFLFQPDFSQLTSESLLSAVGQSFFSLSLGMGCLCTYASYFRHDTSLIRSAASISVIDTLVAILAGLIIFPAAFSVGIQPDAGPSLVFITLPNVFNQAFSGIPFLAYILSILFYVLLALAALTSTISMHEVVTVYIHEEFHISRRKAATMVSVGCGLLGVLCSLSLGVGKDLTLFGMTLFDFMDYLTAKIMLPVGGFFISIFAGWFLDRKILQEELSPKKRGHLLLTECFVFLLRYVAPAGLLLVFLNELGLLSRIL